jgi:hypothetical protein
VTLPFAAGDTGVRAVASVTNAATTGTVGNFGVTLFKPLAAIHVDRYRANVVADFVGGGLFPLEEIVDDACLQLMQIAPASNPANGVNLILTEC